MNKECMKQVRGVGACFPCAKMKSMNPEIKVGQEAGNDGLLVLARRQQ